MKPRSSHQFLSLQGLRNFFNRGLLRSEFDMAETYELKVHLAQDEETGRWYIAESDIPGLWLEADDPMALIQRIQEAAPELIELNQKEILSACAARAENRRPSRTNPAPRPAIRPVFDSPLELALA